MKVATRCQDEVCCEGASYWGYHLILDCKHCSVEKLKNPDNIRAFIQERLLVPGIDMKAYGEPVLAHFATHNEHASGYSMVQLIETSSITAHFAENIGELYLDIFSLQTVRSE